MEGKGEQTDFPRPLSLNPVTAVGRKRAVLGNKRNEAGKGPVAGLNKGGILTVGKVPPWGREKGVGNTTGHKSYLLFVYDST